jgi:hypothetical protein
MRSPIIASGEQLLFVLQLIAEENREIEPMPIHTFMGSGNCTPMPQAKESGQQSVARQHLWFKPDS